MTLSPHSHFCSHFSNYPPTPPQQAPALFKKMSSTDIANLCLISYSKWVNWLCHFVCATPQKKNIRRLAPTFSHQNHPLFFLCNSANTTSYRCCQVRRVSLVKQPRNIADPVCYGASCEGGVVFESNVVGRLRRLELVQRVSRFSFSWPRVAR